MDEQWLRFVEDLESRFSGPMKLRLVLQPAMAALFAVRSGLGDAKAGRPPYFWALMNNPAHRREMLRDGWKSVGTVLLLALALDVVYQAIAQRFIYPGEAIVVALALAIVPYLVLRGAVNRLAQARRRPS